MKLSRRRFVGSALATLAALNGILPRRSLAAGRPARLRILILGGTGFLGPHTVRAALARGHALTLFNRGKTNPGLFPDIEHLQGDRDGNLKALEGRSWDAVIDTSGYVPRIVSDSARLLTDAVRQYVFISTISVYADLATPDADETAPVGRIEDESVEEITAETYGPLKALSEQAAQKAMRGRATVIRPGLIAGPGDPTDRFTYWPVRVVPAAARDGRRYARLVAGGTGGSRSEAACRPRCSARADGARSLARKALNRLSAHGAAVFPASGLTPAVGGV